MLPVPEVVKLTALPAVMPVTVPKSSVKAVTVRELFAAFVTAAEPVAAIAILDNTFALFKVMLPELLKIKFDPVPNVNTPV
jgi:hypothetical protein